jgi:hypothetical protein
MPYLNSKACYKLAVFPHVECTTEALVNELATILTPFSTHTQEFISSKLSRMVDDTSTYSKKPLLIKALQMVVAYLRRTDLSDAERKTVAESLLEGLSSPVPSYHDLVNLTLLGLTRVQNIDQILTLIRTHLVEELSKTFPNKEKFDNCTFFNTAATMGYGIHRAYTNPTRVATRVEMEALEEAIKTEFEKKYHALSILDMMQPMIQIELEKLGYSGEKTAEEAYEASVTERVTLYLKTLIAPDSAYTIENFFIKKDSAFVDLNWSFIQNCIWQKLEKDDYITFSASERRLMDALYREAGATTLAETTGVGAGAGAPVRIVDVASIGASSTPSLAELMRDKTYRSLLCSFAIEHPGLVRSTIQREKILRILLESNTEIEIGDAIDYFKLVYAFFPKPGEVRDGLLKDIAEKCLREETHQRMLRDATLASNPYAIYLYLGLSAEKFDTFFKEDPRILKILLDLSIVCSEKLFTKVTTLLQSLPPAAQKEIFLAKNSKGENALMTAIIAQPRAVRQLLRIIDALPIEMRGDVITAKNASGHSVLMLAMVSSPQLISDLLAVIRTLDEVTQLGILTATTAEKENIFMLARRKPSVLPELLRFFQDLPYEAQKTISEQGFVIMTRTMLGDKIRVDERTFMFLFKDNLLSYLSPIDVASQLAILNPAAMYLESANDYKKRLIATTVAALIRSESSAEKEIGRVLESSSESKKEAIILSLYQIKKSLPAGASIDAAINEALKSSDNELHKALNLWGISTLLGQSSLTTVRTAAQSAVSARSTTAGASVTVSVGAGGYTTASSAGAGARITAAGSSATVETDSADLATTGTGTDAAGLAAAGAGAGAAAAATTGTQAAGAGGPSGWRASLLGLFSTGTAAAAPTGDSSDESHKAGLRAPLLRSGGS